MTEKRNINNCAAKGWPELKRWELDSTKRKTINLVVRKIKMDSKPKKQSNIKPVEQHTNTTTYTTYEKMEEIVFSYARMGYIASDRRFSVDEEWAYRLTNKDFDGRTTKEAADIMRLTSRRVQQLMKQLRFISPRLFSAPSSNRMVLKALFSLDYLPKRIRSSVDVGTWRF